jgi:hypothetical protein
LLPQIVFHNKLHFQEAGMEYDSFGIPIKRWGELVPSFYFSSGLVGCTVTSMFSMPSLILNIHPQLPEFTPNGVNHGAYPHSSMILMRQWFVHDGIA